MQIGMFGLCAEKRATFDISLFQMIVRRSIDDIFSDFSDQLAEKSKEFLFYSTAFDERTNLKEIAQLLIFVRGISTHFEITGMCSTASCTNGKEICDEIMACLKH